MRIRLQQDTTTPANRRGVVVSGGPQKPFYQYKNICARLRTGGTSTQAIGSDDPSLMR